MTQLTEQTARDLIAALEACTHALAGARPVLSRAKRVLEADGEVTDDLIDAAHAHLADKGGMGHRDLQRALGTRCKSATLAAAMEQLAADGVVRIERRKPVAGGRETVFYVMT